MKRILTTTLFALFTVAAFGTNTFAQHSREEILSSIKTKRIEMQQLEKEFLAPSAEDQLAYADFLKQPDSGLVRLLPRETYDSDAVKPDQKSLAVRGGGAYYSFSRRTHEFDYGTEIGFEQGQLMAAYGGLSFGIMSSLGNVPLESIALENPAAGFMAEYKAPGTESEARVEQARFRDGTTIGETVYHNRLKAEVNNTYLLRSVDYYAKENIMVAFRIVRKDTDGSLIIVWNILKKYPTPEVARNR